jgi:hypothetical protein
MRQSLSTELSSPELHEALRGLTSDVTRTGVRSSRDAFRELDEERKAGGKAGPLERALNMVMLLSGGVAFLLGALAIGLVIWALRTRRQSNRYRRVMLKMLARGRKGEEREALHGLVDALSH